MKQTFIRIFLLSGIYGLFFACAEGTDDPIDTDSGFLDGDSAADSDTSLLQTDTSSDTNTDSTDSDSVYNGWFTDTEPPFEDAALHTFYITITPENATLMEENALLEEYIPATVSFDDMALGQVGVRYKGASSLHYCFDEFGVRVDEDRCKKLSIKIKFSEYVETTRLFGLKRINLHALNSDYSKLKDRLSYKLFRAFGVPAPRSGHARVVVNGQYAGLFAMIEQVDGRFTDRHWPDAGDGNLYKESWWTELEEEGWREDLKTNEEISDVSEVLSLAHAIQDSTVSNFDSTVVPYFEIEHFLRYMVVDRAITNVDGITRFYAPEASTEPNTGHTKNFYIYQQEPGGRFVMIPWDMDLSLSYPDDFTDVNGVPDWNEVPPDCYTNYLIWNGNSYTKPPGCDHFHAMVVQNHWNEYVTAGEAFLNGPFQLQQMLDDLNRWEAQIADSVAEDPNIIPGEWNWGVGELRSDLTQLIFRFRNFLSEGLIVNSL
ncbi:MAG: CotH kinase family protein [Deltaproteobacteria bacterium]|nr:CotH kinase family protein [Deltaproteobacteria bacterium]MBN2672333.1 CotH kinase family protein [Deltaproteobacteria bacterium]